MMEEEACSGDGSCLEQADERHYRRRWSCVHDCVPVRCPNYAVCGEFDPVRVLDCHRGLCLHCDMAFGQRLEFYDQLKECPVCLESRPCCVKMPGCVHVLCVGCFRNLQGWRIADPDLELQGAALVLNTPELALQDELEEEEEDNSSDQDDPGGESMEETYESLPWNGLCPICRAKTVPAWQKRKPVQ